MIDYAFCRAQGNILVFHLTERGGLLATVT